jgi:hypothetical protein
MGARQRIHCVWPQAVRSSLRSSLGSIFAIHNETVYISSHLMGSLLFHVLPLKKEVSGTFYSRKFVTLFGTEVTAILLSVTSLTILELSCLPGEHQFQVYTMASSATLGHKGFTGYLQQQSALFGVLYYHLDNISVLLNTGYIER